MQPRTWSGTSRLKRGATQLDIAKRTGNGRGSSPKYDSADRVTQQQNLTNATRTYYGYDNRSRLTSIALWPWTGSPAITSQTYGYDNASRLITRLFDGVLTSYDYDDADQLTLESRPGYVCSYSYDANGNRLYKTLNTVTEAYSYDAADKMLTAGSKSYVYDAAGRTTRITQGGQNTDFGYDYDGRITSITYPGGGTNSFVYNGFGVRGKKADSLGASVYKRNGPDVDNPVIQRNATTFTPYLSETTAGSVQYYHANWLGSVEATVAPTGQLSGVAAFDAYGNTIGGSGGSSNFGFAGLHGYEPDVDSGMQQVGHRTLDPTSGRFLTRDPMKDGSSWYAYCDASPTNLVDPTGLVPYGFDHNTGTIGSVANPRKVKSGSKTRTVVISRSSSQKEAFDKALSKTAKGQTPMHHNNPGVGDPHYHAVNAAGKKKPNIHYNYPRPSPKMFKMPKIKGGAKALGALGFYSTAKSLFRILWGQEQYYKDIYGDWLTREEVEDTYGYDPEAYYWI